MAKCKLCQDERAKIAKTLDKARGDEVLVEVLAVRTGPGRPWHVHGVYS